MKSEGRLVKLADVAELVRGVSYKPKELEEIAGDHVKLLRATNIGTRILNFTDVVLVPKRLVKEEQKLIKNDVVIAMSSGSRQAVGRLAQLREEWDGTFGAFCGVIRPRNGAINPTFLGYVLSSNEFRKHVDAFAEGTAIMNLTRDKLLAYQFYLPSIEKQNVAARILGSLDDKIEINRKTNEALEKMARTLFKSWFVDFDPVHSKKAGHKPEVMDDETAKLFPNSFVDSELGKIPKGWEVTTLGSTLDVLETGRRPKGGVSSYTYGVPSIGAESVNGLGVFDYSKTKYIPQEFYEGTTSGRIAHFDVLLYKDGGKPGEFKPRVGMFGHDFPFRTFCINEHVFRMRSSKLGQPFLYFLISDQRVLADFANKGGKAAIPGINQPDVKSTLFVNPPPEITSSFNRVATRICDKVITNSLENKALADLRDTLLPKLLN